MTGLVLKTNVTTDPITKQALLPCPFCGGKAQVEEVAGSTSDPKSVAFSVGCSTDEDGTCYGYTSLTTFSRRSDAIEGWNKRAPREE